MMKNIISLRINWIKFQPEANEPLAQKKSERSEWEIGSCNRYARFL